MRHSLPILALVLLMAGCSGTTGRPKGRIYPERFPTHVELIGADGRQVWEQLHQVVRAYNLEIEKESGYQEQGVSSIHCRPFTIYVPGTVNSQDYNPAEIVYPTDRTYVRLAHRLTLYLDVREGGLVRVHARSRVRVNDLPPHLVRAPHLVAYRILKSVVEPLQVVTMWRYDPVKFRKPPRQPRKGYQRE